MSEENILITEHQPQLYRVMQSSLGVSSNDIDIGRMGHGLGMQLTERNSSPRR